MRVAGRARARAQTARPRIREIRRSPGATRGGSVRGVGGEQEEIAEEIADAKGGEIMEAEERQADGHFGALTDLEVIEQDAGTERGVEDDPEAADEEKGMDDPEQEIGEHDAGGAGVAEGGGPADADEEERQDREECAEEDDIARDAEQEFFCSMSCARSASQKLTTEASLNWERAGGGGRARGRRRRRRAGAGQIAVGRNRVPGSRPGRGGTAGTWR
jgi:hypothetical protein